MYDVKGLIYMSRLGEQILAARTKRGMSTKELAKKAGVAEKMLLEVETGRRIPSDDQASRFLKILGVNATVADQEETEPAPVQTIKPVRPKPAPSTKSAPVNDTPVNTAWETALTTILQRVPILDATMQETGYRMMPLENGKVVGVQRDKVFYWEVPDNTLSGYRIMAGDLVLMTHVKEMPQEGFVLVTVEGVRLLRKLKRQQDGRVQLSQYDRSSGGLLQNQLVERAKINPVAIAQRVEFVPSV